jgi:phage terminase small subunit
MARLSEINALLDEEGLLIENEKGRSMQHPLLQASYTAAGVVQALTRTLGLSGPQKGLSGPQQSRRNAADQQARSVIEKASTCDLL